MSEYIKPENACRQITQAINKYEAINKLKKTDFFDNFTVKIGSFSFEIGSQYNDETYIDWIEDLDFYDDQGKFLSCMYLVDNLTEGEFKEDLFREIQDLTDNEEDEKTITERKKDYMSDLMDDFKYEMRSVIQGLEDLKNSKGRVELSNLFTVSLKKTLLDIVNSIEEE